MSDLKPAVGESLWWFAFSNGGFVLALLVPVHILFQGILAPLGIVPVLTTRYASFANALGNPLIKLYVFVLIALPLYNAAHRTRILLPHLGIRLGIRYYALVFYGLAVLGTLITGYVVLSAP